MPINTNVTNEQITVSVGETQIDVSVNGGVGPTGNAGAAATVTVGTVTTGSPGSSAAVVNVGSSSAAVLNFTIPAGATGATGAQGPVGPAGTTTWAGITDKPSTFAPSAHQHVIADTTGLQAALDGKQASGSYAAAVHTHGISDVTGLQTALDGKQAAGSYAAASHTHTIANVTGLQTALDGKASLSHAHSAADISDFSSAVAAASPEEVVEYTTTALFPATGNSTLLYIATDASRAYRWTGAAYVEVGPLASYVSVTYGTTSGTACQGNDSRLSDSRTPTGAAGGDLTGNFPNATLAASGVTAGTYTSVTVDAKGRVTAGSNPSSGGVKLGLILALQ